MSPFGRLAAVALAVLIGGGLALYPPRDSTPPSSGVGKIASPAADEEADAFNALLRFLGDRTRDVIGRRGDFGVIVAVLPAEGGLQLREEASIQEGVPFSVDLRVMKERIERGDFPAYGWARPVRRPGDPMPDRVFFEIWVGNHVRRREMDFTRAPGGKYLFYNPEPVAGGTTPPFINPPSPRLRARQADPSPISPTGAASHAASPSTGPASGSGVPATP